MTPRTKQLALGIVGVIIILLAIVFYRDRESAKRAFREGYDSTAGTPARTP
jgi:hypothetical protein